MTDGLDTLKGTHDLRLESDSTERVCFTLHKPIESIHWSPKLVSTFITIANATIFYCVHVGSTTFVKRGEDPINVLSTLLRLTQN